MRLTTEQYNDQLESLKQQQPFAYWWSQLSQDDRNKYWGSIDLIRVAFKAGLAIGLDAKLNMDRVIGGK